MSIEALPNELLVEIFSHTSWNTLLNLSLVNRRWYQVIGHFSSLKLTKSIHIRDYAADVCIPLEVLYDSSREYSQVSCEMKSMDSQKMDGDFGTVLNYCQQRWNINGLRLVANHNRFIAFLQYYKHFLTDVVTAKISVYGVGAAYNLAITMEKLKRLNMIYDARSFCSLSLHAPKLEFLSVERNKRLYLKLTASPKLRSVWIRGVDSILGSICGPGELESILPQASKTTRLEITNLKIVNILSAMFENLQTIILTSVTINSIGNATLECLNLTKLQLRDVKVDKPLKLRVPQLHTLICNIGALQLLHLYDAFKADLLVIDFPADSSGFSESIPTLPGSLPSFRRLHLSLRHIVKIDDPNISWIWPYLSGITELTIQIKSEKRRSLNRCGNIWEHLPELNSVCLVRMEIPGNFDFLPVTVQNVFIEDCSTEENRITFPSSVGCVRVNKLWTLKTDANSAEMVLLPPNRYRPIESKIVQVDGVFRKCYSTKHSHET